MGPTRARKAWAELGVDGRGVANDVPDADFVGMPRLTPEMLARLQGFPDSWDFGKRKTIACRMIGNAFPPPVAMKIGLQIKKVLDYERTYCRGEKKYHKELLSSGVMTIDSKGIPSNADSSSKLSINIAHGIADQLMAEVHEKQ